MDKNLERVRRRMRSKALNVLERIEQLEGPTLVEIEHVDAAIKYLSKMWEDCKVWSGDGRPPPVNTSTSPRATGRYSRPDSSESMRREH